MNPDQTARPIRIRALETDDREAWAMLWDGYTSFYRQNLEPELVDLTFARLCRNDSGMFGLVAEDAPGQLVGLAHCVSHRSTWREGWNCYLEDLFVDPSSRGNDVAEDLIEAAKSRARDEGANRLYWHTQPYNGRARSLYDQVGNLISRVVYEAKL